MGSLDTEQPKELTKQEIKETLKDESFISKVDEDESKKSLLTNEFGHLTLTIHNGINLMNTELIGKSDPYVVVECGCQKFRSKTVKNSQNPIWDFIVDTDIKKESAEDIKVSVFDEDIGNDDPMGYVFLDIKELSNNAIITKKNIPLKNCKSGEINFSSNFTKQAEDIKTESVKKDDQTDKIEELSAIKETSLSSEEKESKVSLDIESTSETEKLQDTNSEFEKTEKSLYAEKTTETKKQEIKENKKDESFVSKMDEDKLKKSLSTMVFGHLTLTIHNGVNLMNTELIGKSDPYVVIEHGGQNFRSKTVKNSQNPIWDFVVDTDIKKESAENIKVSVFDEDIGKDDPMGYVFLDINELSNNAIIT